jgi:hypothetical protein
MRIKFLYPSGLILGIFLVTNYSCQKADSPDLFASLIKKSISTSISGQVTDENKRPVQDAVVKAGSAIATTDVNGNFQLSNVWLDKEAGYIKVEKAGYFSGSRTIMPEAGTNHYVEIELIPKTVLGTFNATANSTLTLPYGGVVQIAAYSLINSNTHTPYNGIASAAAYFVNPVSSNFGTIMPGDLRGITTSHEEKALKILGMMAVELTAANGDKLAVADGTTATLIFPIPSTLLEQAPSSISLWRLDETRGLWNEEGLATKQGNNYVGKVSHFSFWSCALPAPPVNFSLAVMDQLSRPLSGIPAEIRLTSDSSITSATLYTDASGRISGKVPANKVLQLSVFSRCGTVLHSQNIGPFSSNSNGNLIKVDHPSPVTLSFSGKVVTCSGAVVANGYVNIFVNGKNYRTSIVNGSYATTITVCSAGSFTASLLAFDPSSNKYSSQMTVLVNSGSSVSTNLIAC